MNPVINSDNGPAVEALECPDGSKFWFLNGALHRTDGPDGTKSWFNKKGQLHRTDGPAIEYANGNKYWYLNGEELSDDLFLKLTGPVKNLPLYMGMGFDKFISERMKHETL